MSQGASLVTALPASTLSTVNVDVSAFITQLAVENDDRQMIGLANVSLAIAYFGNDSTVTTSTGFPLFPHSALYLEGYTGELWAITDGDVVGIRILEV